MKVETSDHLKRAKPKSYINAAKTLNVMSGEKILKSDIRKQMFQEMTDKSIFNTAKEYAFEYSDKSLVRNVFPDQKALAGLSVFNEEMPVKSGKPDEILKMLHQFGSPATVAVNGGRYFGFVIGGTIPTALAASWLSDFWDQNAGLYMTSPIVSKLETVVESWMRQLFRLPENVVSGFVSGSTTAVFCALAAARYRILKNHGWDVNAKGLSNAPKIRLVAGMHAHGAVLKSISMLGLGRDNIEWVDVDNQGRMIPEKVPHLDKDTILILQAGNVNSGSFDPFEEICDKAVRAGAWIHIDGAFGLWAACSEKLSTLTKGIEKANSWSVDGHKTLNTPYDSGIVLCNDKAALTSAMHVTGSYLLHTEARDGYLYTPEMSRRSRIIELWAALKYVGQDGIEELVDGFHDRAKQFASEIKEEGFQVLNEVVFNQVLVACENDEKTSGTLDLVQRSGECWCGSGQWDGRKVIRVSVCSWATTPEDISRSVKAFKKAYQELGNT
jgi:glutamate/tyrosine decarboxylase-like PLP-dependent enzyme